jgi:lipopolysaccharide/colanic/teichoic acid biosynthesis glycosyltransferase
MKRIADLIISFLLIVLFLPVMLITALLIKIDSPGPIFYSRKSNGKPVFRIGKNAKLFRYFKFRSMLVGTNKVTRIGVFIRRWHLDELPELFLVFIGKMSLVGPRPIDRCYVIRSSSAYYQSLTAKPGITGPWQIHRKSNKTIEEIIKFNRWYARHQCFLTDLNIIIKTPIAIIKNKGGGVTETTKIL